MPRYRLVSRLDSRILSEVFMAQEDSSNSAPATLCKFFFPQFVTQEFAHALVSIAQEGKQVGSPLILAFDRVGTWEGRLVAVRRAIDGYALDDVIRRLHSKEVVLTPQLAIFLSAMAANSVDLIHQKGLIHGALDATNILLGFDGQVSISGLGMMRAVASSPRALLNANKIHRAYRAPELRDPCRGTKCGDVYALGCLAYELLTLVPVGSVRSGGLSTKHDTLQAPSRLNRRINARVDPVIMRALEPAAVRRQPDAKAFADALLGLFPNIGPMPTIADLIAFTREVFPNEVSLSGETAASDLPTADYFAIEDVAFMGDVKVAHQADKAIASNTTVPSFPPSIEPELIDDSELENWDAPTAQNDAGAQNVSDNNIAPVDRDASALSQERPVTSVFGTSQDSRDPATVHKGEFDVLSAPIALSDTDVECIELDSDTSSNETSPAAESTSSEQASLDDWDAPVGQMQQVVHRWGSNPGKSEIISGLSESHSGGDDSVWEPVANEGVQGCQAPKKGEKSLEPESLNKPGFLRKKAQKSSRLPSEKSPELEDVALQRRNAAPTQLSLVVVKPEAVALANDCGEGESSLPDGPATSSNDTGVSSDVSDDILEHLDLLEIESSKGAKKRKEGRGKGAKKVKGGPPKSAKGKSNRYLAQLVFMAIIFVALLWASVSYVREQQKLVPLFGGQGIAHARNANLQTRKNRRMAFLSVTSNVPAFVMVDDVDVGIRAPFEKIPIKPGSRRIQVIWGNEVRNHEVRLLRGDHKMYTENFDEKRKGNVLTHVEQVKTSRGGNDTNNPNDSNTISTK